MLVQELKKARILAAKGLATDYIMYSQTIRLQVLVNYRSRRHLKRLV